MWTQSGFADTVHLCTGACTESMKSYGLRGEARRRATYGTHKFWWNFSLRFAAAGGVQGTRVIVVDSTRKLWWKGSEKWQPADPGRGGNRSGAGGRCSFGQRRGLPVGRGDPRCDGSSWGQQRPEESGAPKKVLQQTGDLWATFQKEVELHSPADMSPVQCSRFSGCSRRVPCENVWQQLLGSGPDDAEWLTRWRTDSDTFALGRGRGRCGG
jgi:hypothetical protein